MATTVIITRNPTYQISMNRVTVSGVTSVNNATGAVVLTGTNGVTVSGTTISSNDTYSHTYTTNQVFQAGLSANSQLITNVLTPVSSTDAANKSYVDASTAGLSWKASVRVATTVAGTLATSFANGQTVDGIVLVTADRILVKNQVDQTANGLYVVAASGAPTRTTDANTGASLLQASVSVQEGTVNADSSWVCTTNAPITIGSSNLTFVQFFPGTPYAAGNGITLTGATFSTNEAYAHSWSSAQLFSDGTAPLPAIAFINDTTMGLYRVGSGVMGIAIAGAYNFKFETGGQFKGQGSQIMTMGVNGEFSFVATGSNQNITLTPSGTGQLRLTGNMLIGGLASNGTGLLQFPTASTSAGGIGFSTDTFFYRTAAGGVNIGATGSSASLTLANSSGNVGLFSASGANLAINAQQGTLTISSNNTTALTLDASQGATFVGQIITQNGSRTAPGIRPSADADSGIYFGAGGAGRTAISKDSNEIILFSDAFAILGNNYYLGFSSGTPSAVADDCRITRSGTAASGVLTITTGNNTTALTIDAAQLATFAGGITSTANPINATTLRVANINSQDNSVTAITVANTTGNLAFAGIGTKTSTALTTTSTDGWVLQNTTLSTSGVAVQYSPRLRLLGHVWNTTVTAADNFSEAIMELRPVSSATPYAKLALGMKTGVGAASSFQDVLLIDNSGGFSTFDFISGNYATLTSVNKIVGKSSLAFDIQSLGAGGYLKLQNITQSGSSGVDYGVAITPTYNQTSTAGSTDLLINRVSTALGSGSHYLIDAQVSNVSKFSVTNAGKIISTATAINIATQTPASAAATGTAGDIAWDSGFLYVCTATNTWKRVAIATW